MGLCQGDTVGGGRNNMGVDEEGNDTVANACQACSGAMNHVAAAASHRQRILAGPHASRRVKGEKKDACELHTSPQTCTLMYRSGDTLKQGRLRPCLKKSDSHPAVEGVVEVVIVCQLGCQHDGCEQQAVDAEGGGGEVRIAL